MSEHLMRSVLEEYGRLTSQAMAHYIPDKEPRKYLYDLVPDYPGRGGKYFRPGLAIATGNVYGGSPALTLNSAVTLELLHNAFLIHDDVEDESLSRRNRPTMHEYSSRSIAINVGDAMNALAMYPLLKNRELLGPKLTLAIFMEIQHMVIESAEGQAMELGWRQDNREDLADEDYYRMILKKTCWYTCIHPIRIGAMIGSHGKVDPDLFNRLGYFMGVAFQIQDDVLNLVAEEKKYGKEIGGDIVEGKRTLILIHLLGACSAAERKEIMHFLSRPIRERDQQMATQILSLMHRYESIEYAKRNAKYMAGGALKEFYSIFSRFPSSKDKSFIESIILYMINRDY
ncbi:polyprenyl synthetase family protein [Terrimonas sp. NA20]|uniref:Polyprenyl synthetase family protein n=1 Tax=Terrimonas ginsenosidimutans TaxID=2908004 RepID=A0ABS9KM71_9BACT|nr:polyprenyl synthetase family protein [Terrimonas ginsenosidimutans]MCG2613413.1 polyprenyl synthetase family protein [Terrimonas ginsenosidimutans]